METTLGLHQGHIPLLKENPPPQKRCFGIFKRERKCKRPRALILHLIRYDQFRGRWGIPIQGV